MGMKQAIKRLFSLDKKEESILLYAPFCGRIVPLSEVKDETFALGILGEGVAVLPEENELRAPLDGKVEQVFDSAHAVTLYTHEGVELLMHIGIDTVELGGRYFDSCVAAGELVKRGDPLIRFDRQAISNAGYDLTTPLVIGNSEEFEIKTVAQGEIGAGMPLLELHRKEE